MKPGQAFYLYCFYFNIIMLIILMLILIDFCYHIHIKVLCVLSGALQLVRPCSYLQMSNGFVIESANETITCVVASLSHLGQPCEQILLTAS